MYELFENLTTWEEAKNNCTKLNGALVDFSDEQDLPCVKVKSASHKNIWIGLTKTNASQAKKRIKDYFLEIGLCECANVSGQLKNFSCTGDTMPSICSKRPGKAKSFLKT